MSAIRRTTKRGLAGAEVARAAVPRRPARKAAGARAHEGRPRDREATTRSLLEAGVTVFARRGYDAATTREVAAEAGVNEGLIQRYFGGKAGLLLAIIKDRGDAERTGASHLPETARDLEGEIGGIFEHALGHHAESGDFIRVLLYRAIVDPAVAAELRKRFTESCLPTLRGRLEEHRKAGRIARRVDVGAAAHAVSSLSFGLAFLDQVVFRVDRKRIREIFAELARVLAKGLS